VFAVGIGAVVASQFHLLSHAIFKALLFLGAGAVIHIVGTRELGRLGGLSQKMPFVRNAFLVGALALAGVPILNGFWSKELVLEASAESAGVWLTGLALAGVGLTALYAARVTWLVFFAPPSRAVELRMPGNGQAGRAETEIHDAPRAMRVALGILAAGVLTSWLGIGNVGELFQRTLPFASLHAVGLPKMVASVATAPLTYLALAATALGLGAWWQRARLTGVQARLGLIEDAANASFGFEWLNRQIVRGTIGLANGLRRAQTGQLNWNAVGIVGGLAVVLLMLILNR